MGSWKKLAKAILFPHMAIMIPLIPLATALLIYSMVWLGTEHPVAYVAYVLSAYTLTVWCVRIPHMVHAIKAFKNENPYARRWFEDVRLRTNITLYGSFIWNLGYAVFQLALGIRHETFWFYSIAAYYLSLAIMRFFLVRHSRRHEPGARLREELLHYRACGWIFLVMNLVLALMIFFMIYWNRTFEHHEITTIAMAAYTFTSFTTAIISVVRYRRYQSPVFSASKAISLAAACVSMLTLTSTMLTTFGEGTTDLLFRRLMLGLVGGGISAFIIAMAIYMILRADRRLRELQNTSHEHRAEIEEITHES